MSGSPRDDNASSGPGWKNDFVTLPGRGDIFVRDSRGPEGAPVVVLLHGLAATGLLNWRPAMKALATTYRVVVVDHRGHGRGIRIREPFRLADCADDVAVLADVLEIERFTAVGYSMGGPISQLVWQRHRGRVQGLVLCATASRFSSRDLRRIGFLAGRSINWLGRMAPRSVIRRYAREWLSEQIRDPQLREWILSEVATSDPVAIVQAGAAILRFDSRDWLPEVDVPASVVLMEQDQMVQPEAQEAMAKRLPDVEIFRIRGDHSACVSAPDLFIPALRSACASVLARSQ